MSKDNFVRQLQEDAGNLAQLKNKALSRTKIYTHRGYDAGGADPITDEDVAGLGLTAVQVTAWITLLEQLGNFFGNSSVIQGDYDSTVNRVRNDI